METIDSVVQEIVKSQKYGIVSLAKKLGVSSAIIKHWLRGDSEPDSHIKSILWSMRADLVHGSTSYPLQKQLPPPQEGPTMQEAVDATLLELREILHRRGRLSSRNEALDELCKLLFAHIMSITHNGKGISIKSIIPTETEEVESATRLKEFVKKAFNEYLPFSLSHEISHNDFDLKIKPQENSLAKEIIHCFEHLAPKHGFNNVHNTNNVDILNDVFGKFLTNSFVDEKQLGQYLTPPEVVSFMIQLAIQDMTQDELETLCNPDRCSDFGWILDPSCGTASFLTELLKTLHRNVAALYNQQDVTKWVEGMMRDVIIGIDKSERMIKLALTNMAMFGLPAARLHLANALVRYGSDADLTTSLEGKTWLILTNPPFGAEFEGEDLLKYKVATRWSRREPANVVSEVLLLERYVDWLAPGGRCLAIVPDSVLTNKGIYESLRNNISNSIDLRAIVSLPPVTFSAAGTSTKTSILYFRKLPVAGKKSTYFAICQNIGYSVTTKENQKTKTVNSSNDLPTILKDFSVPDGEVSFGRKVIDAERDARWDANYHAFVSKEVEQRINNPLSSDIKISDIAALSSERIDPKKLETETFEYIEISDVDPRTCMVHTKTVACSDAPSRARRLVHAGDVLFSTVRPDRRIVGVVRADQDGAVCTTGFAVLRPRNIDPVTLVYLLKTDFVVMQVLRNNIGIAYPVVEEACLLDVLLPVKQNDLGSLHLMAQTILSLEKQAQKMREDFSKEVSRVVSPGIEKQEPHDL